MTVASEQYGPLSFREALAKRQLPIDPRVHPLVKWASTGVYSLEGNSLFPQLGISADRRRFLRQLYSIDPFSHDYCKFWIAVMPSFRAGLADLLQLLSTTAEGTRDEATCRKVNEFVVSITERFDALGAMASKLTTVDALIGRHYSLLAERSAPNTNYALSGSEAVTYISPLYKIIGDSLFDGPSNAYYERYLETASHVVTPELLLTLEDAEVDTKVYVRDHEEKLAEIDIAVTLLT